MLIMSTSIFYLKLNTQRSVCTHGYGWVSDLRIKWQRIKNSSRVSGLLLLISPGPLRSAEFSIPLKLDLSKTSAKETSEVKLVVDSQLENSAGAGSAREGFKLKIGWKWAILWGACGRSPQSRGGLRQGSPKGAPLLRDRPGMGAAPTGHPEQSTSPRHCLPASPHHSYR